MRTLNLRVLVTAFFPMLLCGCVELTSIGSPQVENLFSDHGIEHKLVGMSRQAVVNLFGPPSFKSPNEKEWYYVNLKVRNVLGIARVKESSVICVNFSSTGIVKSTRTYKNTYKNINAAKGQQSRDEEFRNERFKSALRKEQTKKSRVRELFNTEPGSDRKLINNR